MALVRAFGVAFGARIPYDDFTIASSGRRVRPGIVHFERDSASVFTELWTSRPFGRAILHSAPWLQAKDICAC